MKSKEFWDIATAVRYLDHCVIRIGGKPIFISHVTEAAAGDNDWKLDVQLLEDPDVGRIIYLPNDEVDMNPFDLGMVNYPSFDFHQAFIATRCPQRMWKVGLARNNLQTMGLPNNNMAVPINNTDLCISPCLHKTIMGEYPSYDEAKKMLTKARSSVAFSRRFALSGDGKIYHAVAPRAVGTHDGPPRLDKEYMYLEEVFVEDLIHG